MAFGLPKFIKDCLTGPDGSTYDAVRVAFVGAAMAFLAYAGFDVVVNHAHFNPVSFGGGFAALTGGTGAAVAVKQMAKAEPSGDN